MITEHRQGRILLSYRRTDAQHLAGRLFGRLDARFGSGNVFMDVDSIEPGLDYGEANDKAVGSCDVLLAVIGRGWPTVLWTTRRKPYPVGIPRVGRLSVVALLDESWTGARAE